MTRTRTTRNPRSFARVVGVPLPRLPERAESALPLQDPPRLTRALPERGPIGLVTSPGA